MKAFLRQMIDTNLRAKPAVDPLPGERSDKLGSR